MIFLPPTFDYMQYFTEFFQVAAPFVVIAVLFAAFRHIRKSGGAI